MNWCKFFLITINLVFICSCKNDVNQKEQKTPERKIIINQLGVLDSNNIIDTLSKRFIRLENTKESLIGQIDKLIVRDNYIIVLDRTYAKALFIFDSEGKFIRKIGKKGKGPGEYARLIDFDFDRKNNQIVLYDLNARKLILYNCEGKFIKEIKLKDYCGMTFTILNDGLFAFYLHRSSKSKKELIFVNDKGKIINSMFKKKDRKEIIAFANPTYFAKNDSNVYIIPSFYDEVYELRDFENIELVMDFGVENQMVSDKDFKGIDTPDKLYQLNKLIQFQNFSINNKEQFFCRSNYNNQPLLIIGDMKSDKIIFSKGFMASINNPDQIIASYKEYFVTVQPTSFHKDLYPDSKIDDNPCLLFFKLNDSIRWIDNP